MCERNILLQATESWAGPGNEATVGHEMPCVQYSVLTPTFDNDYPLV